MRPETIARIRARMRQAGLGEADLVESFVRGAGSGGQKINKTSSCVQLHHAASGEVVKCQRTRAREVNRWLARQELAERLIAKAEGLRSERQQEQERVRRQKRRRSRRQKARMLDDKRRHGEKKRLRQREALS
ncbi:MAG: peptide chain release factor-like protein [Kiritimatiellae bacterium]|nr:peptide chain release factor-like protein [Kiritimatiellia bacterium]